MELCVALSPIGFSLTSMHFMTLMYKLKAYVYSSKTVLFSITRKFNDICIAYISRYICISFISRGGVHISATETYHTAAHGDQL